MPKKIIIGNWKLHKTVSESIRTITELKNLLSGKQEAQIVIAPSFVSLHPCEIALHNTQIALAAQNVSQYTQGAYTGEVSAAMLLDVECEYVLVGHSERRGIFEETDQQINQKLKQAFEYEVRPVLCIGESIQTREANSTTSFLQGQLSKALQGFLEEDLFGLIVAYEPIWAIGSGNTASVDQIQEVHQWIRAYFTEHYSKTLANQISILYGGSVNDENAASIMQQKDVNGLLVGGASLDPAKFVKIITQI